MKVNVTSSKGLESKLSVTVTKKEIQNKIDVKLDEVKNTINLKGFRPGKAPKELLKKQFGKALYGEVIEKTLNETTFQALKDKKNQIVDNMISMFKKNNSLLLVVPVEGTRARADFWKSGFYHIAKGANVPILPTFLDYSNKRGGFGIPINTSNDLVLDMQRIRDFYAPFSGKFPRKSGPVKLKEEVTSNKI